MSLLNNTIRTELQEHVLDRLNDGAVSAMEDLHFHCFNEDYYVVSHSCAREWLSQHNIDTFDAIDEVITWERDVIGESNGTIDPETIVNKLVYILGEDVIADLGVDEDTTHEELIERISEELGVAA